MRVRHQVTMVVLMCMVFVAVGSHVSAQQTESRIAGKVTDASTAVMPGVTITVTSVQTGAVRTTVSDGNGTFTVTNLGPGTYKVQFALDGFTSVERGVTLAVADVKTADASLSVATVSEAVTVRADAAVLGMWGARMGVNVSPEEVQNLPVNGRNFANLMTLATGATTDGNGGWASVRVNGKSNQQNYLNYDGQKQVLALDQFGGSIGGPLARNRTFFFTSVEALRQKTGLSFTEAVPSDPARSQILAGVPVGSGSGQSAERTRAVAALLAGFPAGGTSTANPLLSLYTLNTQASQRENSLSARIDHRFSDSQSLYVRYLYSKGSLDTPDRTVTPRRVKASQEPQNLVFNWQSLFTTSMVNEVKLGYNKPTTSATAIGPSGYPSDQVSLSGAVTSSSIDARGSTGIARSGLQLRSTSAVSGGGSVFDPHSFSIADTLTWTRAGHTLKFGGEYRRIQSDFQFLGGTTYAFNSINDFIDNRPNLVQFNADSPVFQPRQYYLQPHGWTRHPAADPDLGPIHVLNPALSCVEYAPGMEHVGFSPRARGEHTDHK